MLITEFIIEGEFTGEKKEDLKRLLNDNSETLKGIGIEVHDMQIASYLDFLTTTKEITQLIVDYNSKLIGCMAIIINTNNKKEIVVKLFDSEPNIAQNIIY